MRCSTITWLWCLWHAKRAYRRKGALFSQRMKFLDELRPYVSPVHPERMAYPDAIFWITPIDVDRATRRAFSETEAGL